MYLYGSKSYFSPAAAFIDKNVKFNQYLSFLGPITGNAHYILLSLKNTHNLSYSN